MFRNQFSGGGFDFLDTHRKILLRIGSDLEAAQRLWRSAARAWEPIYSELKPNAPLVGLQRLVKRMLSSLDRSFSRTVTPQLSSLITSAAVGLRRRGVAFREAGLTRKRRRRQARMDPQSAPRERQPSQRAAGSARSVLSCRA